MDENDLWTTKFSTGTLMSANNSVFLTDSQAILDRWKEHFNTLLNKTPTAAEDFLRNVHTQPPEPWMSNPPTFHEFTKAMMKTRLRKSPGPDNIHYELLQHGGLTLSTRLFTLMLRMWGAKRVPDDLKNAYIIIRRLEPMQQLQRDLTAVHRGKDQRQDYLESSPDHCSTEPSGVSRWLSSISGNHRRDFLCLPPPGEISQTTETSLPGILRS